MVLTIITFIIILAVLVFVHEFGHFIVAKKSGMQVDEFGFGFPPRMVGIQKAAGTWKWVWGHKPPSSSDETVYSINWVPLGGFVKIRGENNEFETDPRSFVNRPFWARFATLVAGVFMNLVLAWVVISIGLTVGLPVGIYSASDLPAHAILRDQHIAIEQVTDGSPAQKAGLMSADTILDIDGQHFENIEQATNYIRSHAGKVFNFDIARGNQNMSISVSSNSQPPQGEGPTGIALTEAGFMTFPWYLVPWEGLKTLGIQVVNIVYGFGQLITGHVGLNDLGGPVKIAQLTGQVRRMGFLYLLSFTAFLSINLAIINILPFPALDGGRVLFLVIEKIRGQRNNQKIEQWVNAAGFVLLLLLVAVISAHDLLSLGAGHALRKLIGG